MDAVLAVVSDIEEVLQRTPHILLGDVSDTVILTGRLRALSNVVNVFIQFADACREHEIYPILQVSTECILKLAVKIPPLVVALQSMQPTDDVDASTGALIAQFSRAFLLIQEQQKGLEQPDATAYFHLSAPLGYLLACNSLVRVQGGKWMQLSRPMVTMTTQIQSLWSGAMCVGMGRSATGEESLRELNSAPY